MRVRWKQKGLKWKKIAKKLEITEAWGECKNGRENVERKGCSGRKKNERKDCRNQWGAGRINALCATF